MKEQLLANGIDLMHLFCRENSMQPPPVKIRRKAEWPFALCAYYRPVKIEICVDACARIGTTGMAWSFPGYTVDRTPYGVIQHELGHHVDVGHSKVSRGYRGDFSIDLRKETNEKPITSYCPDDGEWFAEMFRLFVTNPDLLRILRPRTYGVLSGLYFPVVSDPWDKVIETAPERTRAACAKKVKEAASSTC